MSRALEFLEAGGTQPATRVHEGHPDPLRLDVTRPEDARAAKESAVATFGRIWRRREGHGTVPTTEAQGVGP